MVSRSGFDKQQGISEESRSRLGYLINTKRSLLLIIGTVALTPRSVSAQDGLSHEEIRPQTAVVAFATAYGIPIEGIEMSDGPGRIGDSITALIALRQHEVSKQWLVRFQISALTDEERARPVNSDYVDLHSSSGRNFRFSANEDEALEISTAGPFLEGARPPDGVRHTRTLINSGFLKLGLDRFCDVMLKFRAASQASGKHPPPNVILSEQDDRVVCGTIPALFAFVQGIQATPGLSEILFEIGQKPSVWSIVKNRGLKIGINFGEEITTIDPRSLALPRIPLYRLPLALEFNQRPFLNCVLFVTSPSGPFVASAGVVGIVADPPGSLEKRLAIRMIAARRLRIPVQN